MPLAAPLAALLALSCARAEIYNAGVRSISYHNNGTHQSLNRVEEVRGCRFGGRWYAAGAAVTAAPCVRCVCARGGALSCAHRACAPLPDPPPRCHLLHRRNACCPELHCPDGVTMLEQVAVSRANDDATDAVEAHVFPVCVEDGVAFAAGSAMSARIACEQCFCLGGVRRCVQPRCLPPPAGCRARPTPGACCPQRYYCEHAPSRYCNVKDTRVPEGERAVAAERGDCERCFCLRGAIHCQPLTCAPPLMGCTPLLRPGDCCPHQYRCNNASLDKPPASSSVPDAPPAAKVKRKTADPPPAAPLSAPPSTSPADLRPETTEATATTAETTEPTTTEQPDGTVRIIVNGTINCTAELSSSVNSSNDTSIITAESLAPASDSFVVNVTSSLRANMSHPVTISVPIPSSGNSSNTTKEDYDYEYAEPTLPPSLPNLKIIPFVAADAVVEDSEGTPPAAPLLEREDKYPVYYAPEPDSDTPTTTAALVETPSVNLFSPPVQTEGGFVPKGPGILGEYYAVHPGTTPAAPLLSTSMPLAGGTCTAPDGRRVSPGAALLLPCQRCTCLWGRLQCAPIQCPDSTTDNNTNFTPALLPSSPVFESVTEPKLIASDDVSEPSIIDTKNSDNSTRNVFDHETSTVAAVTLAVVATEAAVMSSSEPTTAPSSDETEEDEDDGFSFGSVLQLLLSDTYEAPTTRKPTPPPTTRRPTPQPPTRRPTPQSTTRDSTPAPSSRRPTPPSTVQPFVPLPQLPYTPPRKSFTPNSINRIDHLVLGETTAIKQPSALSPRPLATVSKQPLSPSPRPFATVSNASREPSTTSRHPDTTTTTTVTSTTQGVTVSELLHSLPIFNTDIGSGGPKLAGCNIYGRMYRVGRIILELSSPCQECLCTVAGVHCRSLPC